MTMCTSIIHFWFKYLSDHVTVREAVMNVPLCNDLQDNPCPASWIWADWGVAEYIGEIYIYKYAVVSASNSTHVEDTITLVLIFQY